jgi:hypothetical protein
MTKQRRKEIQEIVSRSKTIAEVASQLEVELDGGEAFMEELRGRLRKRETTA